MTPGVTAVVASPDGKQIYAGSINSSVIEFTLKADDSKTEDGGDQDGKNQNGS